METKRTPGPWKQGRDGGPSKVLAEINGSLWKIGSFYIENAAQNENPNMGHGVDMANAEHCVACVNACEGIPAEILADMPAGSFYDYSMLRKWAELLGGGDLYLEVFRRFCFCNGCRVTEKNGNVHPLFHASSCDEVNRALMALRDKEVSK